MSVFNAPLAAYTHQKAELDAALARVLLSGAYVLGSEVAAFEQEFARWLGGSGEAVGVASGTDALVLALRAFDIGAGDKVITVSHTAGATVAAIRAESEPARLRAIVVVHLYGQAADLGGLLLLANDHGLVLIEDCAQAVGTRWRGHAVGTVGHAGAFSFYPTT